MARIAVLVSDAPGGAPEARAHALFDRLPDRFETRVASHQGSPFGRIPHFLSTLRQTQPALIFLVDPIYAAVAATGLYRQTRRVRVILDTGDLVYDLARELGKIGPLGLTIVRLAEQAALRMSDTIVVRGSFHRDWLRERGFANVEVIPDGVDLSQFHPTADRGWRARFGIMADEIVAGGVGSMHWNARRQTCFGWDLIEALALLRNTPVRGMLIGDGDGRPMLEARARDLDILDRVIFAGHVPYADLREAINALDICLLTQTNDPIAWVRTTGKLPIYLACDRFIIATAVGEAARVLPPDRLLPYAGSGRDPDYPARLAEKIRDLMYHPNRLRPDGQGIELARRHFDYNRLAHLLAGVIDRTLAT
jgi:glycosyltransferase involved in cell wall biosynthesis